jgi:hypothetical protein
MNFDSGGELDTREENWALPGGSLNETKRWRSTLQIWQLQRRLSRMTRTPEITCLKSTCIDKEARNRENLKRD